MMRAHSAAAVGEDSAASTIGGRKSTSSLCTRKDTMHLLVKCRSAACRSLEEGEATYLCGSSRFAECFLKRLS